ncbi:MAG TPA: RHO alpha subunit C-terminal catalytic domain-containing protein, partial [Bryobacteraceae bacterium]|nr:RHO alpha subunit C-terminal catalytic domain-containing protein [Bryobacteraceae bacterium]
PSNWLQFWENAMDPYHVWVLHSNFSTLQFAAGFKVMPKVDFEYADAAVVYHAVRRHEDGMEMDRISAAMLPNVTAVPSVELAPGRSRGVQWWVPVDDTHFALFASSVTNKSFDFLSMPMYNGKTWYEVTEEEHQDFPGDYEAQCGQGPITLHSEEHLATSDRGIAMLRRLMSRQINTVQEGGDPAGVIFDPEKVTVKILSGNFVLSAGAATT